MRRCWVPTLGMLVMTSSLQAATYEPAPETESASPKVLTGFGQWLAPYLGVREAEIQQLRLRYFGERITIDVFLGYTLTTLNLHPHSLRSPDARFLLQDANGLREFVPPPSATFRGDVAGMPGAVVCATIVDDQLTATIINPDGTGWSIEPVDRTVEGLPRDWHAVYHNEDVIGAVLKCAANVNGLNASVHDRFVANDKRTTNLGTGATGAIVATGGGETEIAFDADVEYYVLLGSSESAVITSIEEVMNAVDAIYQDQLGICYVITGFIVRTAEPDPYSGTDASTLINEYRIEWTANVPNSPAGIPRDVAYLFTGKQNLGPAGNAYLNSVCTSSHYGFSTRLSSVVLRQFVLAHLLGHNWGACHCNDTACTGGGSDPDCGIMNIGFVDLTFGARSTAAIDAFRATANCLEICRALCPADTNDDNTINVTDLLALLAAWGPCFESLASFQQGVNGYAGTQDSYFQNFNPDLIFGNSQRLEMQGPKTFIRRSLVRFDNIIGPGPDQIPTFSSILSAILTMNVQLAQSSAGATMHRVLTDWNEGTVTWNNFGSGPGGQPDIDYASAVLATIPLETGGTRSIDVTGIIQDYADGDPAFGWMFLGTSGAVGSFDSSESGVVGERPLLVVDYEASCPADFNTDGTVNVTDLLVLLAAWGACP